MHASDGLDPVADDEIVYRRLPGNAEYYDSSRDPPVQWIAFKPNRRDSSGISMWRAKYLSPKEAAGVNATAGKQYFLVALKAAELRRLGADVIPTPDEGGLGHASVTSLAWERYQSREKQAVREMAQRIAREARYEVFGPFDVAG